MKQVHSQIGIFLANNSDELSIEKVGEEEIKNEHGDTSIVNVWRKKIETDNRNGRNNFFKRPTMLIFMLMLVVLCSAQVVGQDLKRHVDSHTNKYGFISTKTGEWIISPIYDMASDEFKDGYVSAQLNGKWGIIDNTGKTIIPFKYDGASPLGADCAYVILNGKCGIVDRTEKEIVPCKYDFIGGFQNGYTFIKNDDKYGFIDKTGKEIVPPKYDYINRQGFVDKKPLSDTRQWLADDKTFTDKSYTRVELNEQWGIIDSTGKEIIPCVYDFEVKLLDHGYNSQNRFSIIRNFNKGWIVVKKNGKYGLVDRTGNKIVSPKYDEIDDFRDSPSGKGYDYDDDLDYTNVWLNKKWGAIDTTGKEIVPPNYDYVIHFKHGYASVRLNGVNTYIDKTGKIVDKEIAEATRAKIAKERAIQAEKEKQELSKKTKHLLGTWKGRASVSGNYMDLTVEIKDHESASIYVELSNGQTDSDYGSYIYRSPTEISVHCQGNWAPCKIKGDTMVMTMGSSSKLDITLTKQTKSKSSKKKSKK